MSKNLFIVFFLQFCLSSYSQSIVFCVSDSIREFSVEASDEANSLQWEFVYGDGAQIIQGQNSDRVLIEFSSPGDFLLQLTEQTNNGCSTSRVLEITVNPLPLVSFTTDNMCVNQETRFLNTSLSQSKIVSCIWSMSNYQFETENLNFTFFNTGQFPVTLEMTDENGCFNSYTKMVDITNPPSADFYFTPSTISTLNPDFEITNMSSEGNCLWDFGQQDFSIDFEPIHYFDSAGWHSITLFIEDENGCIDSTTKEILMEVDMIMYMPNAFTPNNNYNNENFGPSGFQLEKLTSYHMQILNKWGQVIFESFDAENKWDGNTKNGNPAMTDTYTWSIRLSDQLGKKYHEFGQVDLIR